MTASQTSVSPKDGAKCAAGRKSATSTTWLTRNYEAGLDVGCVCAEKMEDDYINPRRREQDLKNVASRRKRWLTRKWKTSQSGNLYLTTNGFHIVVYPLSDGSWGGKITDLGTGNTVTNKRRYADADRTKLGAFDGMIFLKGGRF